MKENSEVVFDRPGRYALHAIIHTVAQPLLPPPPPDPCLVPPPPDPCVTAPPPAVDEDVVYVRVKVVCVPVTDVIPDEPVPLDPDVESVLPMPKEIDPHDPAQLSGDINGDDVVNLSDFAIMTQQE